MYASGQSSKTKNLVPKGSRVQVPSHISTQLFVVVVVVVVVRAEWVQVINM